MLHTIAAVALCSITPDRLMMFFDYAQMSSCVGLAASIGTPHLLSVYRDPSSFVGWGYPSVFRTAGGYRMVYQGFHRNGSKVDTKLILAADSTNGVIWTPAVLKWPASVDGVEIPNAASPADGSDEFSVAFDDREFVSDPSERIKLLWGNGSYSISTDGERWRVGGRWTNESIDPGISVYRNPLDTAELVVTARPQALRRTHKGRHAGFHYGRGWAALATEANRPALPLDMVFSPDDQVYGVPSFAYGGMVVSHLWRYRCSGKPCYSGGFVSSALAYSYDSRSFLAFGAPGRSSEHERAARSSAAPPFVGAGPLVGIDLSGGAYYHSYEKYLNKTEGALAYVGHTPACCRPRAPLVQLLGLRLFVSGRVARANFVCRCDRCEAGCRAAKECAAWTYVTHDTPPARERCCYHGSRGCPSRNAKCISGAKVAGPCEGPKPPPPPAINLPELFINRNGTETAGQVYPNTVITDTENDRILIHASASSHQHGYVSPAPGTWSSILTFSLRTDGFVYISPADPTLGGNFVSKPLLWHGGELMLNADCKEPAATAVNTITVEVIGYPKYSLAASVPFTGNATAWEVRWNSNAKMASLAGQRLSLTVAMAGRCKLYSLRGTFDFVGV